MHDTDPLSPDLIRRLRSLPGEAQAPYGWEEFVRRADRRRARRARSLVWGKASGAGAGDRAASHRVRWAAAAALLLCAASGTAWWIGSGPRVPEGQSSGLVEEMSHAPDAATSWVHRAASPANGAEEGAEARAAAAERWLASQPRDPAVVSVGTQVAITGLEDRIAQLDDLLTAARAQGLAPASLAALEQQRARLVRSLAQVRFAEDLVAQSSH